MAALNYLGAQLFADSSFIPPDSMGAIGPSQFFVTVAKTPWLTGKHTIFGEVLDGMDVVEAIATTATDGQDRPTTPVVLERVTVEGQAT